jgi:integrase
MRKGELLALKWGDLDFRQRLISVRKSKSGRARHIGMNIRVIEALQSLPRVLHNSHVFPGQKPGHPMKNGIKHSDWVRYLKQAQIEDFHWHDLRHTFACRLVMGGIDLYKVRDLLGHESVEMTQR